MKILAALFLISFCSMLRAQLTEEKRLAGTRMTCWVMEPSDVASKLRLDYEYSYGFLNRRLPQGSGGDFRWVELPAGCEVEVRTIVRRRERTYLEYVYLEKDSEVDSDTRPQYVAAVLVCETGGWLRPVFVCYPEGDRYSAELVSTAKHPLALVVDMSLSGTGAMVFRYLFDLWAEPRLRLTASGHRVRPGDYGGGANVEKKMEEDRKWMREAMRAAGGD